MNEEIFLSEEISSEETPFLDLEKNLESNETLNLTRNYKGLSNLMLEVEWLENRARNSKKTTDEDFDLDISCFLLKCHINKKGEKIYYIDQKSRQVVYNHEDFKKQAGVEHQGDKRTGKKNIDDDDEIEKIHISFKKLDPKIDKILLFLTIYKAYERKQTFSLMEKSVIKLKDLDTNETLCSFELKREFDIYTGLIFGELVRNKEDDSWEFKRLGEGIPIREDLNTYFKQYHKHPHVVQEILNS